MRLVALATVVLGLAAVPFKASLVAGTHHPAINTRWPYTVRAVAAGGKPLRATVSVAVIDPIGGVHPTEFYASKKLVTNTPFRGVFRDAVKWPPESKGYPLTFRVTVSVGRVKRVLKYAVTPT